MSHLKKYSDYDWAIDPLGHSPFGALTSYPTPLYPPPTTPTHIDFFITTFLRIFFSLLYFFLFTFFSPIRSTSASTDPLRVYSVWKDWKRQDFCFDINGWNDSYYIQYGKNLENILEKNWNNFADLLIMTQDPLSLTWTVQFGGSIHWVLGDETEISGDPNTFMDISRLKIT